jgi:GT2 family glycosyltransferase
MKLMIVTPAYNGQVYAKYALSLLSTVALLSKHNISFDVSINLSGTLLVAERNDLINQFMESECTHILCVDADIAWHADTVLQMLSYDLEFVAGIYPSRQKEIFVFRPCFRDDQSLVTNDLGLFLMEYVPAGFMMLKKSAIEKMISKFPETRFDPKDKDLKNSSGWALFNTEVYDGEFWGEDYVFCRKARAAGIDIWINPLFEFTHGSITGKLVDALVKREE